MSEQNAGRSAPLDPACLLRSIDLGAVVGRMTLRVTDLVRDTAPEAIELNVQSAFRDALRLIALNETDGLTVADAAMLAAAAGAAECRAHCVWGENSVAALVWAGLLTHCNQMMEYSVATTTADVLGRLDWILADLDEGGAGASIYLPDALKQHAADVRLLALGMLGGAANG